MKGSTQPPASLLVFQICFRDKSLMGSRDDGGCEEDCFDRDWLSIARISRRTFIPLVDLRFSLVFGCVLRVTAFSFAISNALSNLASYTARGNLNLRHPNNGAAWHRDQTWKKNLPSNRENCFKSVVNLKRIEMYFCIFTKESNFME